jgi:hypothetical protein
MAYIDIVDDISILIFPECKCIKTDN